MRPRTRTARTPARSAHSRSEVLAAAGDLVRASACWPGGAQRATGGDVAVAQLQAVVAARPTSGWLAKPARWSAANRKSPERSPVKTRPVRLPPWAAGARPTTSSRACGSPKPGHRAAPVLLVPEALHLRRGRPRGTTRAGAGSARSATTSRLTRARLSGIGRARLSPRCRSSAATSSALAALASAAAAPFAARLALSASMRSMICARGASGAAVISWPSTFRWIGLVVPLADLVLVVLGVELVARRSARRAGWRA